MFTEKEISQINKIAEQNVFEAETYITPGDDPIGYLKFKFEIVGQTKMISVGEYYDYSVYNITLLGATEKLIKYLAVVVKIFIENYRGESTKEKLETWFKRDSYLLRPTVNVISEFMKNFYSNEYPHVTMRDIIISDELMKDIQETIVKYGI